MRTMVLLAVSVAALVVFGPAGAQPGKHGLPPGLEKKLERGGELPPGWRKKLHEGEILDIRVYRAGRKEPIDDRYERVHVENKVVKILRKTREIIEILNE